MRNLLRAAVLAAFLAAGHGLQALPAYAAATPPTGDPLNAACGQLDAEQRATSPSCAARTEENPLTGKNGLLMKVATLVAIVAGLAAVIIIIVGGFRMITANGDSQGFAQARSSVIGAAVGLIIIVLARSLVVFILERL